MLKNIAMQQDFTAWEIKALAEYSKLFQFSKLVIKYYARMETSTSKIIEL